MDIFETRRQRLRQLIDDDFGGRLATFAAAVERQASYVSRLLAGPESKHRKNMGEELARQIEQSCGKPHQWLDIAASSHTVQESSSFDYKVGDNRRSSSRRLDDKLTESNVEEGPALGRPVPLISWVRAGELCEAIDTLHPGDAEEWITVVGNMPPGTYALRLAGDSMEPRFPSGSIVIVDPERKPDNGSLVIAKQDGKATFKQLTSDGVRWYLKALNPAYPLIDCTDDMQICGVVVQMVQRLV